ncbi:MAG: hypothetical protein WD994_03545 [Pseudomonadales bacterium]
MTLLLFIASCEFSEVITKSDVEGDYETGIVLDMRDLDGCGWLIELESGEKLQPVNLSEDFHQQGKQVRLTYEPEPGMMSACMAGEIVRLTAIREISDPARP